MFKLLSTKEQLFRERRRIENLSARQENTELAASVAFVTLAEGGSIDDVTASEHTGLFSPWVSGAAYAVGALRRYNDELYRCVQAHSSQEDWAPDKAPALWVKVGDPAEEYPAWSQPVGAHDAYSEGDKVTHKGKKWVSAVGANVWEPGVYGWDEVTE